MLDLETGTFSWGDGYELRYGMTQKEFLESRLFQNEVREEERNELYCGIYNLKKQTIDGFQVFVVPLFDGNKPDDLLEQISFTLYDACLWQDWPLELWDENTAKVLRQTGEFLALQLGTDVPGGRECWYEEGWGNIGLSYNLRDFPDIQIKLHYYLYSIYMERGDFDGSDERIAKKEEIAWEKLEAKIKERQKQEAKEKEELEKQQKELARQQQLKEEQEESEELKQLKITDPVLYKGIKKRQKEDELFFKRIEELKNL